MECYSSVENIHCSSVNPIFTPKPACIAVLHELILVLLIATAVTISISPDVLASDQTSSAVRPIQKLEQPGDLTLTIQASRSTLTAGSGFGLTADIKNVSAYPIDLSSRNTVLMLPPELEGFSVRGTTVFFAFYPTDTKESDTEPSNTRLTLEPGNDYTVEWSWDQDRPEIRAQGGFDFLGHYIPIPRWIKSIEDTIGSELQFTFFPPGDYKVNVVVRLPRTGTAFGDISDSDSKRVSSCRCASISNYSRRHYRGSTRIRDLQDLPKARNQGQWCDRSCVIKCYYKL
jgi:hypothetical protein